MKQGRDTPLFYTYEDLLESDDKRTTDDESDEELNLEEYLLDPSTHDDFDL